MRPRASGWDEEWERIGNGHDRRMSNVRKVVEREGGRGKSHRLREIIFVETQSMAPRALFRLLLPRLVP